MGSGDPPSLAKRAMEDESRTGDSERARRLTAFRWGRGRGTWLLSKFREQRGVFRARATTVVIADQGCADEEPEPLAHKLLTSMMTFDLSMTFSCLCDSGGGGA